MIPKKKLIEVALPLKWQPPKTKIASARRYSDRTLKVLWGRAAGRCTMPECRTELFVDDSEYDPVVIIGDIAHVEAASDDGPRGNQGKPTGNRDEYDNLILLCKNCHSRIDGQRRKFAIDTIRKIKTDHEGWVRTSLPERGLSRTGWSVVLLQGEHPIDSQRAVTALRPDFPEGNTHVIGIIPAREDWSQLHQRLISSARALFDDGDMFNKRFAVFPLAPISACVALGFCLTDRPRVRLFQYHRHIQSWDWQERSHKGFKAQISGLPGRISRKSGEVVVCFEISANIQQHHRAAVGQKVIGTVGIQVQRPSTSWLRATDQLEEIGEKTHELFENILHHFPKASRWHLLLATPAPIAVRIGQAMNPSMTPPVQLYEFNRSTMPVYLPSICLEGIGR